MSSPPATPWRPRADQGSLSTAEVGRRSGARPQRQDRQRVVTNNPPLGATCVYAWGPRTSEWGQTGLNILVVDASKVWPGGSSSGDIKQRVLVEVRTDGPDASEIPGVGDGAVFTTNPKSHDATVKAYLIKAKGLLLEVTFHGGNGLAQKDNLIALLRTAASRL